jgi:hypothetical protein
MLQLVYNVHTCNHAMCSHFPPPIMGYICNWFPIMIPIDTISMAIGAPLPKY